MPQHKLQNRKMMVQRLVHWILAQALSQSPIKSFWIPNNTASHAKNARKRNYISQGDRGDTVFLGREFSYLIRRSSLPFSLMFVGEQSIGIEYTF